MTFLKHSVAANSLLLAIAAFVVTPALADCGTSERCWVSGVRGVVKGSLLPVHISPSRDSRAKFNLREGDEVRNRGCESQRGEFWCKVELPNNRYEFGWVLERYLSESDSGAMDRPQYGGTSIEYKRGYNDGLKGNLYAQSGQRGGVGELQRDSGGRLPHPVGDGLWWFAFR